MYMYFQYAFVHVNGEKILFKKREVLDYFLIFLITCAYSRMYCNRAQTFFSILIEKKILHAIFELRTKKTTNQVSN
jgi:hypothetical protein